MADPTVVRAIYQALGGKVAEPLIASALDAGMSGPDIVSMVNSAPAPEQKGGSILGFNFPKSSTGINGGAQALKGAVDARAAAVEQAQQQDALVKAGLASGNTRPGDADMGAGGTASTPAPDGAGGTKKSTGNALIDSYLAAGYVQIDPVNSPFKVALRNFDKTTGQSSPGFGEILDLSKIGSGSGAGSGGGAAAANSMVTNKRTGRTYIIGPNGQTLGENPDLREAPDAHAPDLWTRDDGAVFQFDPASGAFKENPGLSSSKQPGVVTNSASGKAFSWNSKNGQWENAPQFDSNPDISPERKFAFDQHEAAVREAQAQDVNNRFDLSNSTGMRDSQNAAALAMRGQDFALAPALAKIAQEDASFTRDTIAGPADWQYRAFMQRGGTSPDARITNADLINNLSKGRTSAQDTLNALAASRPKFDFSAPPSVVRAPLASMAGAPGPAAPPVAAPTAAPAVNPYDAINAIAKAQAIAPSTNPAQFNVAGDARPGVGAFKMGTPANGTKLRHFMVGEPVAGNPNPEMVHVNNPGPDTTIEVDPIEADHMDTEGDKVRGFAFGTGTGGWTMFQGRQYQQGSPEHIAAMDGAYGAGWSARNGMVAPAEGNTGGTGGGAPQLPAFGEVTQQGLVDAAHASAPPSITALQSGQRPAPLRFGFALPTIAATNSLTKDEKTAYNSFLGLTENTTLADVQTAQQQQMGNTGTGLQARRKNFVMA